MSFAWSLFVMFNRDVSFWFASTRLGERQKMLEPQSMGNVIEFVALALQ